MIGDVLRSRRRVACAVVGISLIAGVTCAGPELAYGEAAASHWQADIAKCRELFEHVVSDPSAPGGVAMFTSGADMPSERNVVCVYGSLEDTEDGRAVAMQLDKMSFESLVLRSTGGRVDTWLAFSEVLVGRVKETVVDEICTSSCANYAFLLGDQKRVPENALVIWHGGPTSRTKSSFVMEDDDSDSFDELAARTEAYYLALGVKVALLEHTTELTLGPLETDFLDGVRPEGGAAISIDGFAIDPLALRTCYNVVGLENMWHPGFFQDVYRLGQARSRRLHFLMRPGRIQNPSCGRTGDVNPEVNVSE